MGEIEDSYTKDKLLGLSSLSLQGNVRFFLQHASRMPISNDQWNIINTWEATNKKGISTGDDKVDLVVERLESAYDLLQGLGL